MLRKIKDTRGLRMLGKRFQRRQLKHAPTFLIASVPGTNIPTGVLEAMMEQFDERATKSGRQAHRHIGRSAPSLVWFPVVAEGQLAIGRKDFDHAAVVCAR